MTPSAAPGHFQEAVSYFRRKVPMTENEFRELLEEDHDRAFMVSGLNQLSVVESFMDALDGAISQGSTLEEFKAATIEMADRAWGAAAGTRLELIFRTNVQTAYSRGRYEQATEPEVLEARPFWKFLAIDDAPVLCPLCEECMNTLLPADSPWWLEHYPPLHHRCRCRVQTLTEGQGEGKVTAKPSDVKARGSFGQTPDAELGDAPDLTSMDPGLRTAFLRNEKRQRPR